MLTMWWRGVLFGVSLCVSVLGGMLQSHPRINDVGRAPVTLTRRAADGDQKHDANANVNGHRVTESQREREREGGQTESLVALSMCRLPTVQVKALMGQVGRAKGGEEGMAAVLSLSLGVGFMHAAIVSVSMRQTHAQHSTNRILLRHPGIRSTPHACSV